MKEEWKNITNYERMYQISNYGQVKSMNYNHTKKEQVLKPGINTGGYLFVVLWKNNTTKQFLIHRLVALHYIENVNNKLFINHLDGDKLNNYILNLEWATSSENQKHAYKIGLRKPVSFKGEHNPSAKLTEKDILEIRLLLNNNISQKDIAQKYGVSISHVSRIKSHKKWSHI